MLATLPQTPVLLQQKQRFLLTRFPYQDVSGSYQKVGIDQKLTVPNMFYVKTRQFLTVEIYLDYENLVVGLIDQGIEPNHKTIIDTIRNIFADQGNIAKIHAYADWQVIEEQCGEKDVPRELTILGVKIHYLINNNGKNSADMEMANDIRTVIDRSPSEPDFIDVLIIGSGDRDFKAVIETALARGKKVVILGCSDSLSQDLVSTAEVRILDENFAKESRRNHKRTSKSQFGLLMSIAVYMNHRKWSWIYSDRLYKMIQNHFEESVTISELTNAGFLQQGPKPNSFKLSMNNPDSFFAWWIVNRLDFLLNVRKMDYVDSAYLANGMSKDKSCKKFGIGQTRNHAEKKLEQVATTGWIVKKPSHHPKNADKIIDTWSLAER